MSTEDACDYLGVSTTTLFKLVDEGQLVAYRPSRSFRFRQSDLDAYLESVRVKPGEVTHLRADNTGRKARPPEG